MYIKEKVYCGAEEYSFEEMRGARWREKKRAFDKLLWEGEYICTVEPAMSGHLCNTGKVAF